jgi:hypothetical protein
MTAPTLGLAVIWHDQGGWFKINAGARMSCVIPEDALQVDRFVL